MTTQYHENDHVKLVRNRVGTVRFIGQVHFAEGLWFGIELDNGYSGKNNGTFRGVRYFTCPDKMGLFIQEKKIEGKSSENEVRQETLGEPETKINPQTRLERGDNVTLMDGRTGVVAFIGRVKFARGEWIGLILDPGHPGKNDGSMKGHRYFKCPQGQGLFVTRKRLKSKSLQKGPRTKKADPTGNHLVKVDTPPAESRRGNGSTSRPSSSRSRSTGSMRLASKPSSTTSPPVIKKSTTTTDTKKNNDNKKNSISSPSRDRKKRAGSRSASTGSPIKNKKDATKSPRSMRPKRSVRGSSRNKTPEQVADPVRRSRNKSSTNSLKIPEKLKQFPLLDEPCFHGKLNLHDSENLLKRKGDWLLRLDRRKITASVRKTKSQVDHVEIAFEEKKKKIVYSFKKNGRKTVTYRSFDELMKSGLGGKRPVKKAGADVPKRAPEPKKDPKRVPEKKPPAEEVPEKKKTAEPVVVPPAAEDEDSDDFILAIKKDQDVKPSEPESTSEPLERPSEDVDESDDGAMNASGTLGELFNDDDIAAPPTNDNTTDAWGVEADASTKAAVIQKTQNDETDFVEKEPVKAPVRPRKRSADLSADTNNNNKSRKIPDIKKRTAGMKNSAPTEQPAGPIWFSKLPPQKQLECAAHLTRVVEKSKDPQTDIVQPLPVIAAMEKKFGFSEEQIRELYYFLADSHLPAIQKNEEPVVDLEQERNDVLGQSMKPETRLTEDEESAVEKVFSALSLGQPGLELVEFHTLAQHFEVPLSDEEINSLFPYIDTEMQGHVSARRFLSFLREEMNFVPHVEESRVLIIASIKVKVENGVVLPREEEKTMAPEVRGWLDGAVATLSAGENQSENIPQKRTEPKIEMPTIEVPGGYTKVDLLEEWEDLFDIQYVAETREALVKGLQKCCVPCDFNSDSPKEKMYIKHKQQILVNISQYVSETKKWFNESVLISIRDLIKYNLFRTLPYSKPFVLHDPDDDPKLDPAWEHLHPCYEILLRLVIAPFTKDKMVRRHLENSFLENLVNMFMSEDPRERDYLKVILHRFYGKFLKPRPHIRKTMHEMLFNFIYKNPFLPGVCEILEILGSIINGFSIPLKDEHKDFLNLVLIPLHKAPLLMDFSAQLNYCITQFVAKDPGLTPQILEGLLRYWPVQSSQKEVLFLTEIEAILDIVEPEAFDPVVEKIFDKLGQCMCSVHFQVAEQALNLTANETISYYITGHRQRIVPVLYPFLQKNLRNHWHDTVRSVTVNILATLREMDTPLYKKIVLETKQKRKKQEETATNREIQWNQLLKNVNGS